MLRLTRPARPSSPPTVELPPSRRARLLQLNERALAFYQDHYPDSWPSDHLTARLHHDLAGDPRFQPGHAPAGWTTLVDHLRRHGATDDDLLAVGLARHTRRGQVIDLFRDRLVLPIRTTDGDLVGFVARRHPDRTDHQAGPRYLNTPTTDLYAKHNHLYGAHLLTPPTAADQSAATGVPVIVEGPIDALAVTVAGGGRYVGVAALGTALSPEQAAVLAITQTDPVVALDPDPAGADATRRAFRVLTNANLDPQFVELPTQSDPAAVVQTSGAEAMTDLLRTYEPLADRLDRTGPSRSTRGLDQRLELLAARPPRTWAGSIDRLAAEIHLDPQRLRERFLHRLISPGQMRGAERPRAPETETSTGRPPVSPPRVPRR